MSDTPTTFTNLSVNINKVALIRNSRGADMPNVLTVAADCERFGAQGITVHPRPDERHIRYDDVRKLKPIVTTELNVEGNPTERFMQLVKEVRPHQVTLVPDDPNALTSNEGWDTVKHQDYLKQIITDLHSFDIRVSIFVDPVAQFIEGAATAGADRIELYTGPYAHLYPTSKTKAVAQYIDAARYAHQLELGINAGHDLSLKNLAYLKEQIPYMAEVSIGHALISDALYLGLENTIQMYCRELGQFKS